jgi:predicted RNA-binding protein with TRAM domain
MVHRKKRGYSSELTKNSHCRIAKKPPVEVGDELEVNITDVSPSGDGMSRIQRYVIYVPGAKPRDRVKVKINKIGEKSATAEIMK